jgi:KUP system potassium uptake protein
MKKKQNLQALYLAALGVVFGDIGTSPLYALRETFQSGHFSNCPSHTFGILSLIFWSFMIVVSFKYVILILRADNHGEGVILSLSSLCSLCADKKSIPIISFMGMLGASFFYGDAVITPAISSLGALEGLSLKYNSLAPYVPYLAIAVLIVLFQSQRKGTHLLGLVFGPIMLFWFLILGGLGLYHVLQNPVILKALNPYYAISFLTSEGIHGFLTFGAVVLVLTGAEALYADLGHFGRRPIQMSWFWIVFPSLILNYFGQGALIYDNAIHLKNPFYAMVSDEYLIPFILLSTIATFIASQAVISGVYSMTFQAIQLGLLPRMRISHTSNHQYGQVYAPFVNQTMMFVTIFAVLIFKTSDNMAAAYGITVTGIMVITTLLAAYLSYRSWQWSLRKSLLIFVPLLLLDLIFFSGNIVKIHDGGWFQIILTVLIISVFTTWRKGRMAISKHIEDAHESILEYIETDAIKKVRTIKGAGVYLNRKTKELPTALALQIKHNQHLHEKLIFITINMSLTPYVSHQKRFTVEEVSKKTYQVIATYGYKEIVNLPNVLEKLSENMKDFDVSAATMFLTRSHAVVHNHKIYVAVAGKTFPISKSQHHECR